MNTHNCKYYDSENGWCKKLSDWHNDMPDIEYCIDGPCPYEEPKINKFVVNAKYNIGDNVWHYEYFDGICYPSKDIGKIYKINIEITKRDLHIYYHVATEYNGVKSYDTYLESNIFKSYEECEKWCNECVSK